MNTARSREFIVGINRHVYVIIVTTVQMSPHFVLTPSITNEYFVQQICKYIDNVCELSVTLLKVESEKGLKILISAN